MSIRTSLFGPRSKYDRSLPYTYVARVSLLDGIDDLSNSYFADTICGLIDCLDANEIQPRDVRLYGLYVDQEIELDLRPCLDADGHWLARPDICHSLERHFRETLDTRFKGHHEHEPCDFEDRDRQGGGPY
jgi:hypothetical protein